MADDHESHDEQDSPVVFRLRSGYEVCFASDTPGMIEHLQEAISEGS